jgi:hypothetical protein
MRYLVVLIIGVASAFSYIGIASTQSLPARYSMQVIHSQNLWQSGAFRMDGTTGAMSFCYVVTVTRAQQTDQVVPPSYVECIREKK